MKFNGKTVLITGGNSGIGAATAIHLANLGAQIIVVGRNAESLLQAHSNFGAMTIQADVSKVDELRAAFANLPRLDGLFVNAGISEAPDLAELTERDYDQVMDINAKGAFFTFLQALPYLNDYASVVFTSSVAHDRGRPGDPVYSASKAAVRSFARTLAADEDVLKRKIRVNCVSPGAVLTPLTRQKQQAEIDSYIASIVPMGRWGEAEEIAHAVAFLLSSDSSYMTGAEIAVDGGLAQI